jgi:hypothetical protein
LTTVGETWVDREMKSPMAVSGLKGGFDIVGSP